MIYLTLVDRKVRLLGRYNENIPYTKTSLNNMLRSMCGENGYILEFRTNEFEAIVGVELIAKKQRQNVNELLERVLPCNMVYETYLIYNTWERVSTCRWIEIQDRNWIELREEVLRDGNVYSKL